MTEPTNQPAVECDCPLPEGSAFRCQDIRQQQKAQHPSRCYCQCHTRHQPPAVPLSVRVLIALDEDARVRECVVLTDRKQADELYHRLRDIWGGANVAMASRAIDALPLNLHEKIAEVTEIVQ